MSEYSAEMMAIVAKADAKRIERNATARIRYHIKRSEIESLRTDEEREAAKADRYRRAVETRAKNKAEAKLIAESKTPEGRAKADAAVAAMLAKEAAKPPRVERIMYYGYGAAAANAALASSVKTDLASLGAAVESDAEWLAADMATW